MASQYGLFTPIQYNGETTYGSNSSPDTAIGSVQSSSPTNANSFTYVRGTNRAVQKAIYGQYTTGITISYLLHDFTFLRHFVGDYDGGSDTEGDPNTLTTGDNTSVSVSTGIQAFSMEIGNDIADNKTTYVGCIGNDFTISGTVGAALTVAGNIIAQKGTDSDTATSYTEPTTLPWVFSQGVVKYGSSPTEVPEIENFSITYTNNLIQQWGAGAGRFMKQPIIGVLDITWSITMFATSSYYQQMRDAFYGASNTPIAPTTDAGAVETDELKIELSEGSTRSADIYLDKSVIENISEDISIGTDNIVSFTITGRSFIGESSKPIRWWSGGRA